MSIILKENFRVFFLILTFMLCSTSLFPFNRSPLRKPCTIPQITTRIVGHSTMYTLKDSHLEEGPIFRVFDKQFFYSRMLPCGPITYRNTPESSVEGKKLNALIENLLAELRDKKIKKNKKFTDFTILKTTDFNFNDFCGLLVLKFKDYPFVLKLFIENPKSFVQPYNKGLEPGVFFVMGGGIMRHLTGFTRIKNLEDINKLLSTDPYWSQIIDTPRKWHWLPANAQWFEVEGKNIGISGQTLKIELPCIYAIVADEIVIDKKKTLLNQRHALRCMRLCQFTDYRIDPHIQNFHIERDTGKLVLIDTENFRILVGLREKFAVDSYISWYLNLGKKYMKDKFFRNKKERLQLQSNTSDWDRLVASV